MIDSGIFRIVGRGVVQIIRPGGSKRRIAFRGQPLGLAWGPRTSLPGYWGSGPGSSGCRNRRDHRSSRGRYPRAHFPSSSWSLVFRFRRLRIWWSRGLLFLWLRLRNPFHFWSLGHRDLSRRRPHDWRGRRFRLRGCCNELHLSSGAGRLYPGLSGVTHH